MNVQCSVIRVLVLHELELGYNATEAIKNNYSRNVKVRLVKVQ